MESSICCGFPPWTVRPMNSGANRGLNRNRSMPSSVWYNRPFHLAASSTVLLGAGVLLLLVTLVNPLHLVVADAVGNEDFAGLVDIGGGRKIYLKCGGRGSPTVVLVGGLRASADDWSMSNKSTPAV